MLMPRPRPPWLRALLTWLALLALGALSLLLSFLHLGPAFVGIALALAAAQAALALVSFMHVGAARLSGVMVPVAVAFFVALLVSLTATDVATRRTFPRALVPSVDPDPSGAP
jgi:caa(3)-type oxidase subunit IV